MKLILNKHSIFILLYIVLTAVFTLPIINARIFSFALIVAFWVNIFIILLGLYYVLKNSDKRTFIIVLCILICGIVICFINGTSITTLISLLALLLGLYYSTSFPYSKSLIKILSFVGLTYNFVSLLLCRFYYQKWVNNSDNMINPNTVGIMNLFFAIIINSFIDLNIRNVYVRRFILVVYNMIIFFNLYSYKGRTSLFAYFIFVLFVLVLKKPIIKQKKIIPVLVFFTIVGGYIFPFLYINTPQSIIDFIARSTGKPFFSGREVIWSRFFLALKDIRNFIIGPGSWRKEEFTTLWADNHVYSMHNNYLDNMLCYGVIGALFIISFTVYRIFIWAKNNKIDNYICVCGYLCFLILGYTENTYNYAFFAVLSNVVLGMALYEDNLCLPQTFLSSNKISCK